MGDACYGRGVPSPTAAPFVMKRPRARMVLRERHVQCEAGVAEGVGAVGLDADPAT